MKINMIIITLMFVSSMVMVSAAEEGNFTIDDTILDVEVDVVVDYDSTTWEHPQDSYKVYCNGEFEIDGTMEYDNEIYNAELGADGTIFVKDETVDQLHLYNIDGKVYQNGETQYLYKDNDYKYYGHIESGYNVDGWLYYNKYLNQERSNLNFSEYSIYITTRSKPIGEFTLSSPPLGLGYKGSVEGDSIPPLYTYRDQNTWERVVSETYPENHDGAVICTPARIAGEPLVPTGYWETAKGQRTSEWKANNN